MKTYNHINQHNMRHNISYNQEERKPMITTKTYRDNIYSDKVKIVDKEGNTVATVVYAPDSPLSCGARVYILTDSEHVIVEE